MDVDSGRLLPIACTLGPADGAERLAQWRRLYDEHGAGRDVEPGMVALRFRAAPDLAARLADLVAAERECCGFLDWQVDADGGAVVVRVGGTEEALARLPLAR